MKHDQSFYRASRQLSDETRAHNEYKFGKRPEAPKTKLLVRRQNPGKLTARRRAAAKGQPAQIDSGLNAGLITQGVPGDPFAPP